MDLATLYQHCMAKPGATDGYPFGSGALVCKVHQKMFALIADEADPLTISLKCEPELAAVLRETHEAVEPGYHLNKRHWNTVHVDGTVPDAELRAWIEDSYDLVVEGLPRRARDQLGGAG
jgi:predicted DNA-binding protein (MmcQ/YjbR family)